MLSVAGRLIEHAVAIDGFGERRGIARLGDIESVEAGALHEQQLVAQDLAGRPQLAAKSMALAQGLA